VFHNSRGKPLQSEGGPLLIEFVKKTSIVLVAERTAALDSLASYCLSPASFFLSFLFLSNWLIFLPVVQETISPF